MIRNVCRVRRCLVQRKINRSMCIVPLQARFNSSVSKPCMTQYTVQRYLTTESSHPAADTYNVDPVVFEQVCNETLESLCDYFEELIEQEPHLKGADVTYSDGVLTVDLVNHGTYVINRQSPNKQIWLSSPHSGPKRYDLVLKGDGHWIYKHDGVTLHKLLQDELSHICTTQVEFHKCSHSLV